MKELSIEQKAQAYDKALKRAKMEKEKSRNLGLLTFIDENFPELEESEDYEKIKKRIIQALHGDVLDIDEISKCTAWLEKQDNISPTEDELEALRIAAYEPTKNWSEKLQSLYEKLTHCEQGEQKEDATRDKIAEYLKKLILDQAQRGAHMLDYEGRIEEEVDFIISIAKKELKKEKQGEHAKFINNIQIGDQVTRNQDGVLVNLSQLKRVAKRAEKQGELIKDTDTVDSNEDGLVAATIEYANKVKPKFKVGDWIITNKKHIWYVDETPETTSYLYRLINQYGKVEVADFEVVDEKARLWTIQDAKDGDVLACNNGWTCIFKILVNDETFSSYCFMDNTKWFCETGSECHTLNKEFMKAYNGEIKPATKEQRDTLEKAMADAGYTFDFEKKELKKIEQKPTDNIESSAFKDKLLELFQKFRYIKEGVPTNGDIIDYVDAHIQELIDIKPWSEEDENRINRLIAYFEDKESFSAEDDIVYANWFKTLKERVQFQPKQGWSEEDKNMLQSILDEYKSMPTEKRNWLKSLRDRVQTKRKWSEEDSRILYNVKAYIGYAAGQRGVRDNLFKEANEWLNSLPIGFVYNKNYNEDMVKLLVGELKQIANDNNAPEQYRVEINWLKSLRPQPRQEWSEEDEKIYQSIIDDTVQENQLDDKQTDWLRNIKYRHFSQPQKQWKPSDLPHWKKSTLPNDNTTGFNSDYFCHNGYCINYKELFEKLPKDD